MIIGKYRIAMNDNTMSRCGFSKQKLEEAIDEQISNPSSKTF